MKLSKEVYNKLLNNSITVKENKYKNKKVIYNGIKFDSIKEKKRYMQLLYLEKAGLIKDIKLQYEFELQPAFTLNKKKIRKITYIADFYYYDNNLNDYVVEDVKSEITKKDKTYCLKKKLFQYKYQKEIIEI